MSQQTLGRVVGSKIYAGTANSNSSIATDLAGRSITPLIYDLYISTTTYDIFQYQLVENTPTWAVLMNIKGVPGTFSISKTYASITAMNAGYATDNVPLHGLVMIDTGNIEDEDNAKLFEKGDTQYNYIADLSGATGIQGPKGETGSTGATGETGATFTPAVDNNGNISWTNDKGLVNPATKNIKGPKGDTGDTGATPNISVTVTQLPEGSSPTVTRTGTDANPTLTFGIPKGDTGATGATGETGAPGATGNGISNIAKTGTSGKVDTYTITFTSGATTTFTVTNGNDGTNGQNGTNGEDGKTPTLSINAAGELVATYTD